MGTERGQMGWERRGDKHDAIDAERLDMLAVQRDDELLDALAARRAVPPDAEPVAHLLAALATDVDMAPATPVEVAMSARPGGVAAAAGVGEDRAADVAHPASAAVGRGRRWGRRPGRRLPWLAARGPVAATVAAAVISVGGVAAALGGADPLAPVRAVFTGGDDDRDGSPSNQETREPPGLAREMTAIESAIVQGDLERAQELLDSLRDRSDTLSSPDQGRVRDELERLEDRIENSMGSKASVDGGGPPLGPAVPGLATPTPPVTTPPASEPGEGPDPTTRPGKGKGRDKDDTHPGGGVGRPEDGRDWGEESGETPAPTDQDAAGAMTGAPSPMESGEIMVGESPESTDASTESTTEVESSSDVSIEPSP